MPPTERTAGYISGPAAATEPRQASLVAVESARRIILVEGMTDQIAVERVASRRGVDLAGRDVVVAPMGGAHAVATFLEAIDERPRPPDVVVGLCDEREAHVLRSAFARSRWRAGDTHVCRPDLEAELIRALTPTRFLELIEREGALGSFRTLQRQGVWRDRPIEEQLHRFLRAGARRGHVYVGAMVDALADDEIPAPLDAVVRPL